MLYEDSEPLSTALTRYYSMNGLPADGGITDKWSRYKIGGFELIAFPNFPHRVRAILRHDVHHILNNLDTSSLGEGLIAAWELGSGCGRYWISWCMEPQALWWGLLYAPKKTFQYFANGRQSKNFFNETFPLTSSEVTVGELRKQLLPENFAASSLRDLPTFVLCAGLGVIMIAVFIPIFIFFTLWGLLFE